ncbi:hypothetical protein APX70_05776 [Pseudomonas syringae pv. maculicola]|uniref:Antibacterial effector protein Tle3 C-terminal domain-containing protein n=1 Tax=Pseudomonas syringae pv. maculicola TaxID=59511 RepID=A0A3M2TX45_PSEYM|nr:hypothetical protein APX70_05776 [Pseudomonas syringae pv. maculicola]
MDRPDDVAKGVALGKDEATFMWVRMPSEYDSPNMSQQEAQNAFNALSDDPENHTRALRKIKSTTNSSSHHEREETPREARERMEKNRDAWSENSYHSGILRSPENHRWVTAMDIAIGQAKCLDDPAMRDVLIAIADWKIDKKVFEYIEKLPDWVRLSHKAQALVKASNDYYVKGKFPPSSLVPLTPPPLVGPALNAGTVA